MVNTDLIAGVLLLLVSGTAWLQSQHFSYYGGVFVWAMEIVIAILGAILFVKGLLRRRSLWLGDRDAESDPEKMDRRYMIVTAASAIAYVLLIPHLGFVLASVFFFGGLALYLSDRNSGSNGILTSFGTALVVSIAFYALFRYALVVPLPTGP